MKASELIEELQRQIRIYGDDQILFAEQDGKTEITRTHFVIDRLDLDDEDESHGRSYFVLCADVNEGE